ncbi:uncharacterized protein LOC122832845 isoform X4 [Gambusia affinis]|nr:uncharacterized protein LOC122832845 isoform X4 [Gambusia affinis]
MGFQQPHLQKQKQMMYFILLCVAVFITFKISERYLQEVSQILKPAGKLGNTVTQLQTPTKDAASFIAVNMTKTLLVSAYLEHRTNPQQVRVIAVVLREETVIYRCVLLCRNNQVHVSDGDLQIHTDHFGFRYGTADILCVIPSSCDTPSHVAVSSAAFKGFLEVIPWSMSSFLNVSRGWLPLHGPGDIHYFGQITALNDCLYRNMYRSKYVALHDIDELILPQTVKTWTELLPLLESKYTPNKCYMFENNVFPNNVMLPRSGTDPARWRGVPGVDILAHLHQEPVSKDHVYEKFKIIVNPRLVVSVSVHGVLKSHSMNGCAWVDRNIARMYHTRAQMQIDLPSDQLIYDGRLLSYSETLIKAVNVMLSESRIL